MNKILNRDEFGLEVNKFMNGEELNEGIFQFLKSFFKDDWKNIKSKNASLKSAMENIDKGLDGFTVLKRSNCDACAQFRQALCDFANDLLDAKLKELKDNDDKLKEVVMGLQTDEEKAKKKIQKKIDQSKELTAIVGPNSVKSKAVREKIQSNAQAVDDVQKKYPEIAPWADALKRSVKNLINDVIIQQSDSKEKDTMKKLLDNKKKEDEKWLKSQNDLEFKTQDEKIKELQDERKKALTDLGVTQINSTDGNKALIDLKSAFDKLIKENFDFADYYGYLKEYNSVNEAKLPNLVKKTILTKLSKDNTFGFPNILDAFDKADFSNILKDYENTGKKDNKKFEQDIRKRVKNIYFNELNEIYGKIANFNKSNTFGDVPVDAVQVMYSAIALAVGYGLTGDDNFFGKDKKYLNIMTKCCIEKDATIGYSFPLVDENKPDEGTVFVALMKILADAKDDAGIFDKKKDAQLLNSFKSNMSNLFKDILKNADELKKKAEEQKKKEADALEKKEAEEDKKEESGNA